MMTLQSDRGVVCFLIGHTSSGCWPWNGRNPCPHRTAGSSPPDQSLWQPHAPPPVPPASGTPQRPVQPPRPWGLGPDSWGVDHDTSTCTHSSIGERGRESVGERERGGRSWDGWLVPSEFKGVSLLGIV